MSCGRMGTPRKEDNITVLYLPAVYKVSYRIFCPGVWGGGIIGVSAKNHHLRKHMRVCSPRKLFLYFVIAFHAYFDCPESIIGSNLTTVKNSLSLHL